MEMLRTNNQLVGSQSAKDKDFCENKRAALDHQICALVYEHYTLSDDEIKIVKGAG